MLRRRASRSRSSTCARWYRLTWPRSRSRSRGQVARSWCRRRRSPRVSAPRSWRPSRRKPSTRCRRRSGVSRRRTCPIPYSSSRRRTRPTRSECSKPSSPSPGPKEMARYEFKLPDIGEGLAEAEVGKWLVKVGEHVVEDQPVIEMMTDKAAVELPSPGAGVVLEQRVTEGEVVKVGSVLYVL